MSPPATAPADARSYRPRPSPDWTSATSVGNVTTVTLNVAKDNVQFVLRAVGQNGNRSPVAFPETVTT